MLIWGTMRDGGWALLAERSQYGLQAIWVTKAKYKCTVLLYLITCIADWNLRINRELWCYVAMAISGLKCLRKPWNPEVTGLKRAAWPPPLMVLSCATDPALDMPWNAWNANPTTLAAQLHAIWKWKLSSWDTTTKLLGCLELVTKKNGGHEFYIIFGNAKEVTFTTEKLLLAVQMLTIFRECGVLKPANSSYIVNLHYGNLVFDPAAFTVSREIFGTSCWWDLLNWFIMFTKHSYF